MEIISIRRTWLTWLTHKCKLVIDLNEEERHILFIKGLQLVLDDICAGKYLVIPIDPLLQIQGDHSIEINDKFERACIEVAVQHALEEFVRKNASEPI